MCKIIQIFILTFTTFACKEQYSTFQLNQSNYEIWRSYIEPKATDLAWAQIPWRSSFQEGLAESYREQKPMLLWAMNGHPLGCT